MPHGSGKIGAKPPGQRQAEKQPPNSATQKRPFQRPQAFGPANPRKPKAAVSPVAQRPPRRESGPGSSPGSLGSSIPSRQPPSIEPPRRGPSPPTSGFPIPEQRFQQIGSTVPGQGFPPPPQPPQLMPQPPPQQMGFPQGLPGQRFQQLQSAAPLPQQGFGMGQSQIGGMIPQQENVMRGFGQGVPGQRIPQGLPGQGFPPPQPDLQSLQELQRRQELSGGGFPQGMMGQLNRRF